MPRETLEQVRPPCGLFGKTPAAGDFLRLNLSAATTQALDGWMSSELARLNALDPHWKVDCGAAPSWRFVAEPQAAGSWALAGVAAPSCDRVGRAFPCLVVARLTGLDATKAVACTPWFDRADAVLQAARGGSADRAALLASLAELGQPQADDLDVMSLRGRSTEDGLFLDVRSESDGRSVTLQAVLAATPLGTGASLWWRHTSGGAKVFMAPGLPARQAFAALFGAPAAETPAHAATVDDAAATIDDGERR